MGRIKDLVSTSLEFNEAMTKSKGKVQKVMHEFKHGELHSGSKKGPKVTNRKQAVAIALSEQKKARKGKY